MWGWKYLRGAQDLEDKIFGTDLAFWLKLHWFPPEFAPYSQYLHILYKVKYGQSAFLFILEHFQEFQHISNYITVNIYWEESTQGNGEIKCIGLLLCVHYFLPADHQLIKRWPGSRSSLNHLLVLQRWEDGGSPESLKIDHWARAWRWKPAPRYNGSPCPP